jgi:hypothetical protein
MSTVPVHEVFNGQTVWQGEVEVFDLHRHPKAKRAYSLRRVAGGGVAPAHALMLQAWQKFPREWVIAYNLACYACRLGKQDEAREWLQDAFDLASDKKAVKLQALNDRDLEPLWLKIGEV